MIVNGNYEFFDFESNKPKFIEAFVAFYGEEYRDIITSRINSINYRPFHSEDFVANNYYETLKNHKKEIVDILLSKYNLPQNGIRENLILNDEYPDLWHCLYGGEFVENLNITDEEKETILKYRNLITTQFGLSKDNKSQNFIELLKFRLNYVDAVREIEKKYDYDIFYDMDFFDKAITVATENLKERVKELGYLGEVNFFDTINPDENNFEQIVFNGDIRLEGVIQAFTTEADDIINDSDERDYYRLDYICRRLEYLNLIGVKFKYLNPVSLYDYSSEENIDNILKEYEYQKNNIKITMPYYYSNVKNFGKLYSQGQFIPREIADKIETARCEEVAKIYSNCKFGSNLTYEDWLLKINSKEQFNYYSQSSFIDDNIYSINREVFMLEDPIYNEKDFVHNLIHEINHAISFQFIDSFNEIYIREGVDESILKLNGFKVDKECKYANKALLLVEETWNELQAEKISEIFYNLYPDFKVPNYDEVDLRMNCNYINFYFILKDVYDLYEEEIKKSKVDIHYNFFKRHGLESNTILTYYEYFKSKLINKFNKDTGVVDFYKILDLAYITEYFNVKILPNLDTMFNENLLTNEEFLNSISQDIKNKIFDIVKKKNLVIQNIIKESSPNLCE